MSVYTFYMKDAYGDDYEFSVRAESHEDAVRIANGVDDDAVVGSLIRVINEHQSQHPDDLAVDRFASVMKEKMAKSRDKGRGGWDDPTVCKVEDLGKMLIDHISKGDVVDIANFCMMLHERQADRLLLRGLMMDTMNKHHEALEVFRKIEEAGPWTVERSLEAYRNVPVVEDASNEMVERRFLKGGYD